MRRKTEFANGEYYHIYNRGVDKRDVFQNQGDYFRFLKGLRDFNSKLTREERERKTKSELSSGTELSSESEESPLVEIIAYCLNLNHFHLILKQTEEKGIETFMHKQGTGYSNYFNKKNDRSGSLFQGPFKSIHIDSNEYLLYISAYVNKNNFIHGYGSGEWKYSSLPDYTGKRNGRICSKDIILGQFDNNAKEYEKFMDDNALYMKEKKETEKYLLE